MLEVLNRGKTAALIAPLGTPKKPLGQTPLRQDVMVRVKGEPAEDLATAARFAFLVEVADPFGFCSAPKRQNLK